MKKWWKLSIAGGLAALFLAGCAAALTSTSTPAPTPTPTAIATPTATPWPADLLFYSDFEDDQISWGYNSKITEAYVADGLYYVNVPPFTRGASILGILTPDESGIYTDVVISVSVASMSPLEGNWGFECRGSKDSAYILTTDAYGRSAGIGKFIRFDEDRWEWIWLNLRERGEGNPSGEPVRTLKAVCVKDTLALYADGRRLVVARDNDDPLQAGNLYVLAGMSHAFTQPVRVSLDAVSVRRSEEEEPPPPAEVIAYTDDFSDPESGWPEGEGDNWTLRYLPRGGYYMETQGSFIWTKKPQALFPMDYQDFAFEVEWLWAEDNVDSTSVDLLCRWSDGNSYQMIVRRNGEAQIWRYLKEEDEWTELADGQFTPSDAVRYHMRAECRGSHLALDVNHRRVAEAEDDAVAAGGVGIRVTSKDQQAIGAIVLQAVTMTLYPQGGTQP